MSVFKKLDGGSHNVDPVQVYASQSFSWISGSDNNDVGISINLAKKPPSSYPSAIAGLGGETAGGFYSYPLWESVEHLFFYDVTGSSAIDNDAYVVNIGSGYYGDHIKPSSFRIDIGDYYIVDNGSGELIDQDSVNQGSIFYKHGIAVIQKRSATTASGFHSDGAIIASSSTSEISFNSTVTIYEHTVNCKLSPSDYGYTFNPTVFDEGTGSITYNDLIISGSQTPYITTIGLYNDFNELLAVAKVSKPVTRMKYTDQTFVVKFDE